MGKSGWDEFNSAFRTPPAKSYGAQQRPVLWELAVMSPWAPAKEEIKVQHPRIWAASSTDVEVP